MKFTLALGAVCSCLLAVAQSYGSPQFTGNFYEPYFDMPGSSDVVVAAESEQVEADGTAWNVPLGDVSLTKSGAEVTPGSTESDLSNLAVGNSTPSSAAGPINSTTSSPGLESASSTSAGGGSGGSSGSSQSPASMIPVTPINSAAELPGLPSQSDSLLGLDSSNTGLLGSLDLPTGDNSSNPGSGGGSIADIFANDNFANDNTGNNNGGSFAPQLLFDEVPTSNLDVQAVDVVIGGVGSAPEPMSLVVWLSLTGLGVCRMRRRRESC